MMSFEFNRWLFDLNFELKNKNREILLILDYCYSHKITSELSNIELLFLPKNSTSKLQPLDAGIIKSLKAKYFGYQLSKIVNEISPGVIVKNLFKEITIKDEIIYSKYAWDYVSKDTIINCWKKVIKMDDIKENCKDIILNIMKKKLKIMIILQKFLKMIQCHLQNT
ncbi:Tigger transposable element-derived protein 6 [Dictyocoela muelleri]|nr:Tigger transposable element-derived protein 6 [Dictyocoela muelleri]